MRPIEVPDGSLVLDTNQKLTATVLADVAAYRDKEGRSVFGIERYVSLYTINTHGDIDPVEAGLILSHVPALGLVQHCLEPPKGKTVWTASVADGVKKGQTAKSHADLVAYPSDSQLSYDNEDCDGDVSGEINAWVNQIARPPLLYTGFAPGLTEQELYDLPDVHCYWGAFGAWNVAVCGVAMRQGYPAITIGGVEFDVNIATADKLGRRVVLATAD
jgi:hypothetical protein